MWYYYISALNPMGDTVLKSNFAALPANVGNPVASSHKTVVGQVVK